MVRSATTFDRRERRGPHGRSAWVALGALALAMVLDSARARSRPCPHRRLPASAGRRECPR